MKPASTTLRARLLRHVILPLALTWLVGALLALAVARYFTQQAFDRGYLHGVREERSARRHDPGLHDEGEEWKWGGQ